MPPENEILISALVSTYRAERFMRGLLEDLEAQTIRDRMEIVIVDSNSPENEGHIVREFQQRFDNIVYERTPERENAHVSVNRAFARSRGKYVTPAATDDRHDPSCFERLVNVLEERPDVALAYADAAVTQTENETLADARRIGHFLWPEFDPRLLFDVCYIGPHPVYRRSLHDKYGGFDEAMTVAGDYELWLRFAAAGETFVHVPEVLTLYFQNPRGNEYGNPELCDEESERARIRHWPNAWGPRPRPGTCFFFPVRREEPATPAQIAMESEAGTDLHPSPVPSKENEEPLVSVVIPTHDRPEWLARAVTSALRQTLTDVEIIVVNDGGASVDGLLAGLDPQGRVHSLRLARNRERSNARNAGLSLARGRYVAYLDDDDWWDEDHLRPLVEKLEETGAIGIYSDARTVIEELRGDRYEAVQQEDLRLPDFNRSSLLVGNFIPTPCLVHRRDALATAGVFDPSLSTHEDWDLWIRLTANESFHHAPQTTANISWRNDGSSTTSGNREDFPVTAEKIHRRYATESTARAGVVEAQQRYLDGLRARLPKPEAGVPAERREPTTHADNPSVVAPEAPAPARHTSEDRITRARAALGEGKREEATHLVREILTATPDHGEGWLLRGILDIQSLDYESAEKSFAEASRLGGDDRRCRLGLGMAALGRHQAETAWGLFSALAQEHPADDEIVHWVLRTACIREAFADAVPFLVRHLQEQPANASVRFAYAGLLMRLNRLEEATAEYETLRETAPDFDGLADLETALAQARAPQAEPVRQAS